MLMVLKHYQCCSHGNDIEDFFFFQESLSLRNAYEHTEMFMNNMRKMSKIYMTIIRKKVGAGCRVMVKPERL